MAERHVILGTGLGDGKRQDCKYDEKTSSHDIITRDVRFYCAYGIEIKKSRFKSRELKNQEIRVKN